MRGSRALLATLALGLVLPATGPVLYDGVGFPDEPYRYVAPPPGYRQTPPPTPGYGTSRISNGRLASELVAATDEQGSQAVVYLPAFSLAFAGPAPTGQVQVAVTPSAPDGPGEGGAVNGNVYTVSYSPAAQELTLTGARVSLREATGRPPLPVVETRPGPGRPWRRLDTDQTGADVFSAAYTGAGQYALVQPGVGATGAGATAAPGRSSGGGGQLPLVLGVTVGLLVLVVAGVRARQRPDPGPP